MINFNGELVDESKVLDVNNRSFLYGDGVFETLRYEDGKIWFVEDHYFRLMASMRMLRMEIPMEFTLEYFESELLKLAKASENINFLRFVAYRKSGGLYTPMNREIEFVITCDYRNTAIKKNFKLGIFKDFYVANNLLSSLKSTEKLTHVLAGIFAEENAYDASLLLNTSKQVVETHVGNLFILKGNILKTAKLEEGAVNGIIRKKIIEIIEKSEDFEIEYGEISPFELQKSDELFITNIRSITQPISHYKKKTFGSEASLELRTKVLELV